MNTKTGLQIRPPSDLELAVSNFKLFDALVMEAGKSIPDALRVAFHGALSAVNENVDVFIAADTDCDQDVEKIDQMITFLKLRKAHIQARQEGLRELVKGVIEKSPDIPYRGALGTLYTTSSKSLTTTCPERLTEEDIVAHDIPREYVRAKTSLELNKTAVTLALKAGAELPWAKLTEKSSLAITSKTKQDKP